MEELTQAQHKAAEALYQQAAPGAGSAAGGQPGDAGRRPASGGQRDGAGGGDVIDAEVVDEGKQ